VKISVSLFQPIPKQAAQTMLPGRGRPHAPRTLDEYVGREHLIGPGSRCGRRSIGRPLARSSFGGPSGHGKNHAGEDHRAHDQSGVIEFSACSRNQRDQAGSWADAERARQYGTRTIVFNRRDSSAQQAQQDAFLLTWKRAKFD